MITIFSAEQYLEKESISDIEEDCLEILDKIISLEIAFFNMRNTVYPKFCDGYNIDVIDNLIREYISLFENKSDLIYTTYNIYRS